MKRDTIFYHLFKQSPTVLFDLLQAVPENADRYRFESVAVKEPKFEIDGILLPPEDIIGTVFFTEVQFQYDKAFYERIFAEIALYYYRNRERFSDWQVIVIYPSRSIEQSNLYPHRSLLDGPQVHRIFLDELGSIRDQPLWISLMILTTVDEAQAPAEARHIIGRSQAETTGQERRAIIEMATTIISYKFTQLSTKEVEAMLDITFEETRVYREIKEKAEQKGRKEGLEKGRKEAAASLILRQIGKRFGQAETNIESSIQTLTLEQLEELSEALLDFETENDLAAWLARLT